jgi:acetoin utilization deacetylase AcuC-like enzyme
MRTAFAEVVQPAATRFKPDIILVSWAHLNPHCL